MRRLPLIALFFFALPAAAQTMEPGEWQFTGTMTMSVQPAPQVTKFTQCVTKAQAENPIGLATQGQPSGCTLTPGARTGDGQSWTMACPKEGMTGSGKMSFGRGTMESEVQMTIEAQGEKMQVQSRISARRVGPCKTK